MFLPEVPGGTVGMFAIVTPGWWWSGFLPEDYERVAQQIFRAARDMCEPGVDTKAMALSFMEEGMRLLHDGAEMYTCCIGELSDHDRQALFLHIRNAAAVTAYLHDARFFVLTVRDGTCRFERLGAESVSEARELLMLRQDVRAVERLARR